MRFRINLQWKILLLAAGTMTLILLISSYLHGLITGALVEDYRYNNAISQVITLAKRTATHNYFRTPDDLQQEMQLIISSRRDFKQLDAYRSTPRGLELIATTAPEAPRLPVLDEHTPDNELGELDHPLPEVFSIETERNGARYWEITVAINDRDDGDGNGYISALVLKSSQSGFVNRLQRQHNLVLSGAVLASVTLFYLLFALFFRRPARDLVQAMAQARRGDLQVRARVRRDDELGEIARSFNSLMDEISERHREREELITQIRSFNDRLRQEVERATQEARLANEQLLKAQQRLAHSERLAVIGQLTASLAHEIGTPLNAISGHLKLLARSFPQNTEAQRRIQIIETQLDFIVGIVKKLLARTHRPRPALVESDVNALIREFLALVKPTLDERRIETRIGLAPNLPPARVDQDAFRQVFLNLVNNSLDAMPDGGRIEITTALCDERTIEIIFRDTGTGIAPEDFEHLFEPMWTTKPSGSGFGLAIAREIMREHGGQIEAIPNAERGAIFRLTLPAMSPSQQLEMKEGEKDVALSAHHDRR
ncbi:MAG: HAMP domain-containing protein [Pyrinomonas methylaliphatogenes]|nr:HAMP domain-containing protein [Pyrinomonas methylaliphatogenes]